MMTLIPRARSFSAMHTVIVVEDHPEWRKYISALLQKNPELQLVCACADGEEAITKIQEYQPDVIILDLGLPSLDGIEVIRHIRSIGLQPAILLLSADASPEIVEKAFVLGALGYVLKSDGSELLKGIETVLSGKVFLSSNAVKDYTK